jgi:murein DD-endopeptidase MepM/ murein hydrolase activator NlpD
MSKFAKKIEAGQRVKQNQTIGFVGSSGLATAAHLHYEYRINGSHQNPRTVKLPKAAPINNIYKQDFEEQSSSIMRELQQFKETQNVSAVLDN